MQRDFAATSFLLCRGRMHTVSDTAGFSVWPLSISFHQWINNANIIVQEFLFFSTTVWVAESCMAACFTQFLGDSYKKRFSLCCPVCLSLCNVGVLWPNGWIDQDATWYGGKPWPRRHCVRLGPAPPQRDTTAPTFSAHVYCGQKVAHLSICWASIKYGNFLNIDISQGSVTTCLSRRGIFNNDFIVNLLVSLSVKEFRKSVNFDEVRGKSIVQEYSASFLTQCACEIAYAVINKQ